MTMHLVRVTSPADCIEAFRACYKSKHAHILTNLEAYLKTWQTPDGLGGLIVTWWSSSIDTAEAHAMNQAPYMLGVARLYSAGCPGPWLDMITHEARGLCSQIDENNLLRNGWGDLPGYPLAPVIGFSAAGGLFAAAAATGADIWREAGDRILYGYENVFTMEDRLYHGVANQTARWAVTILQRYALLGEQRDLDKAICIGDTLLKEQIKFGAMAGAFYQGSNSDSLISVYVGKCLYALLALYKATEENRFLDAAVRLGEYLLREDGHSNGLFINYREPSGPFYSVARKAGSVLRRVSRSAVLASRVRRSALTHWTNQPYPVFIARASDTLRGLVALSEYRQDIRPQVKSLLDVLLNHQQGHGGFPNTIGYCGDPSVVTWQDRVAPTRWNSYVFQLLAELVAAGQPRECLPPPTNTWPWSCPLGPSDSMLLSEDEVSVCLTGPAGQTEWRVDKRTGKSRARDAWRGELTAERSTRQMLIEHCSGSKA